MSKEECVYVACTPLGNCCGILNKECYDPYKEECDEPKWNYILNISRENEEND